MDSGPATSVLPGAGCGCSWSSRPCGERRVLARSLEDRTPHCPSRTARLQGQLAPGGRGSNQMAGRAGGWAGGCPSCERGRRVSISLSTCEQDGLFLKDSHSSGRRTGSKRTVRRVPPWRMWTGAWGDRAGVPCPGAERGAPADPKRGLRWGRVWGGAPAPPGSAVFQPHCVPALSLSSAWPPCTVCAVSGSWCGGACALLRAPSPGRGGRGAPGEAVPPASRVVARKGPLVLALAEKPVSGEPDWPRAGESAGPCVLWRSLETWVRT